MTTPDAVIGSIVTHLQELQVLNAQCRRAKHLAEELTSPMTNWARPPEGRAGLP